METTLLEKASPPMNPGQHSSSLGFAPTKELRLTDLITVDLINHPGIRAIHSIMCIKFSFDPFYMESKLGSYQGYARSLTNLIFGDATNEPPGGIIPIGLHWFYMSVISGQKG